MDAYCLQVVDNTAAGSRLREHVAALNARDLERLIAGFYTFAGGLISRAKIYREGSADT